VSDRLVDDDLPSPWVASRRFLVVYAALGAAAWGVLVLADYDPLGSIFAGFAAAGIPAVGELQAGYRVRWAMARIDDRVGGRTEAREPEPGALELAYPDRGITVRGEVDNFRVSDMAAEADGERFAFAPRHADEAVEWIHARTG
jgi:hypothetical protein